MSQEWIYTIVCLAWLAGAACFVLGLHRMNSPATARERQPARARPAWPSPSSPRSSTCVTREGGLSGTAIGDHRGRLR